METINNITAAATNAIWGQSGDQKNPNTTTSQTAGTGSTTTNPTMSGNTSGQEPISGELGNTSAGEPYDRGNVEPSTTTPYTATTIDPRVHTGSNAGPHESNLANKADPRVDSDRDGSRTAGSSAYEPSNTMGTPLGAGSGAVGGSSGLGSSSTNAGPHSSNLANKADPRVDSDRDGSGIGSTSGGNTGFYSSTSQNPLTSRPADSSTTSTTHHSSNVGGINSSRSTGDHSSSPGHHGSNTGASQSTYGSTAGDTSLSADGSQSINPGPTGSTAGKSVVDASQGSRTSTGPQDAVNNTPNTRPFSEFGGNKTAEESDKTGISFREPGPTPSRGLHPIEGQGPFTGAHSHRGSSAFQNTQDTHDTLHKRDHLDSADHTQDRKSSTAGSVSGSTGSDAGISGKGTPGGMPEVVARDLEKIKTGKGKPPGGSDAELGLDEAHGGPKSTKDAGAHGAHGEEKMGMMDKIKAKLPGHH